YVGLSRAVSGTLQSGEHAAMRTDSGRVRVFDTFNAASGQALLVWRAAEMAQAGDNAEAILAELERLRTQTRLWAITRDISHVVRGGRMPAWAAPLARLTALTPMARVGLDGRLGLCGMLFARRKAPEVFARKVAARLPAGQRWRVIVGHCDAQAEGERLLAALHQRLDVEEAFLVETGAAIGAHAGRGALIVATQPAPTR
ncbi:MAG: DegV family EDD domain-containing protein, partial [Lysobacteraceae bacterium]